MLDLKQLKSYLDLTAKNYWKKELTKKLKSLHQSGKPSEIWYTCGPTIYAKSHLGNLRIPLIVDFVKRYREYRGFTIFSFTNITDYDDKIVLQSRSEQQNILKFIKNKLEYFLNCLNLLKIKDHFILSSVFDNWKEIVKTAKNLSKRSLTIRDQRGLRIFDLKKERLNQNFYILKKTPRGYKPGWHIECSALIGKILKVAQRSTLDCHFGGLDLKFPHHENELRLLSLDQIKVKKWVYIKHLYNQGLKMSKSSQNLLFLEDLELIDRDFLRFYYYYNSANKIIDLTINQIYQIKKEFSQIRLIYKTLCLYFYDNWSPESSREFKVKKIKNYKKISSWVNLSGLFYRCSKNKNIRYKSFAKILIEKIDKIFKLALVSRISVEELIATEVWQRARNNKNYQLADQLKLFFLENNYLLQTINLKGFQHFIDLQ